MYFNQKTFPFRRPPELDGGRIVHPVVIVGAGPVGLTLALDLALRGIRTVVVEQRDCVLTGSRCVGIRRRSMQAFDRVGVAAAITEKAIPFERGWVYYGTRLLQEMSMTNGETEKHPALLMLQQCWVEQVLIDRAVECGVDIRWSSKVVAASIERSQADLTIETPQGRYSLSGSYAVAADGAHSGVRKLLGLKYEGQSFEQQWVIVDFHMPSALPGGRRLWFDPPYAPGSTTLLHRLPFDIWRLDFLIGEGADAAEAARPDRARERIAAHLSMMGVTDDWTMMLDADTSIYRPNALSMPSYRHGPCFFVGDAAHLLPIFSGRGMNNGIEDASNLAWKLAEVLGGDADPALLDSFDQERRPAVLANLSALLKTALYMNASSKGIRLLRDAVLSLALQHAFARTLFEPFGLVDAGYPGSVLNASSSEESLFSNGPGPGVVLPDFPVTVPETGRRRPLHESFGQGFTLLYWNESDHAADAGRRMLVDLTSAGPVLRLLTISADPNAVHDAALWDQEGIGEKLLDARPGTLYLVRPDLVVAGRWRNFESDDIVQALHVARGVH